MKLTLLLFPLLTSAALGFSVTVDEKQTAPSLGSRLFFDWCDMYKETCVSGCSSKYSKYTYHIKMSMFK